MLVFATFLSRGTLATSLKETQRMKKTLLLMILFWLFNNAIAQEPTLRGILKISVENGTIDGDFMLTDLPQIDNYLISLNSGLNVQYFKNQENKNIRSIKQYDQKISYESFLYTFPTSNKDSTYLPKSINVKYTGKFPVHKDTTNLNNIGDWKGNIAFSDNTLRMDGTQTSWYPTLHDLDNDKRFSAVKYFIEIICDDCSALYLNGNDPAYGSKHTFTSEKPIDISLFVGQFNFYYVDNNWYLNPDINKTEMAQFSKITEQFKDYYTKKLEIPYHQSIKFIQTTPTSKNNSYMFIDYPTIVNIGRGERNGLGSLISDEYPEDKAFIAHELAHYYFGAGEKIFNSPISSPICEGFAEYLSLKATEDILGIELYRSLLKETLSNLKENSFYKPISKIESEGDYNNKNSYSYNYFPVILLAIEQEIGKQKMWKWTKYLIVTETTFTDYEFLKDGLVRAINDNDKSKEIIEKYFTSDKSLENALKYIKTK